MGSSPSTDYEQPAPQGPPIEQVNPASPPPGWVNFLPSGNGYATGITPGMDQAIAGYGTQPAPVQQPPAQQQAGPAAAGLSDEQRLFLAKMMARENIRPERGSSPGYSGRSNYGPGIY